MARGFERPPWWAVVVMVVGLVGLGVGLPMAYAGKPKEPLSQSEINRLAAAESAADASQAAAAPQPLTVRRSTGGPLRVLFAGDSLTLGYYASADAATFRQKMVAAFEKSGPVTAKRIGTAGLTTAEVQPEIAGAGGPFDLAVIEVGTNDYYKSTVKAFTHDYPVFLDAVRARSPQARLLCVGVWQLATGALPFDDVISRACQARGGQFVSVHNLYQDTANRGPAGVRLADGDVTDNSHPNDRGHTAIAAALLAHLKVVG